MATERQIAFLEKHGIKATPETTVEQASTMINAVIETAKQAQKEQNEQRVKDIKSKLDTASELARHTDQHGRRVEPDRKLHCFLHSDNDPSLFLYRDGSFYCFQCGAHGSDVIDFHGYLKFGATYDRHGRDFWETVDELSTLPLERMPAVERQYRKTEDKPVLEAVLDKARLLDWTDNLLREPELLQWLERRGVTQVVEAQLGFTGNDPSLKPHEQNRIVIPHFYRGVWTAAKLRHDPRQPLPEGKPKYISITGSRFGVPFGADQLLTCPAKTFIQETELDALAGKALITDAAWIAIPAHGFRAHMAHKILSRHVYVIQDNDSAGEGLAAKVREFIPRARTLAPPKAKDLGEYISDHSVPGLVPYWLR